MKSTLSIVALVFMALISSVRPAQADWLDWMQEWSGPGPFHEGGSGLFTWCHHPFSNLQSDQNTQPCTFFDVRRLVTDEPDDGQHLKGHTENFPVKVTAVIVDIGASWRLRKAIDIGVGAGLMTATGNKTAVRPIFTAPRVVIQPAVIVGYLLKKHDQSMFVENPTWSEWSWKRLLHAPKFYVRGSFIGCNLTGDDLGVPGTTYDRTFEYVVSRGFYIDIAELLTPQLTK